MDLVRSQPLTRPQRHKPRALQRPQHLLLLSHMVTVGKEEIEKSEVAFLA